MTLQLNQLFPRTDVHETHPSSSVEPVDGSHVGPNNTTNKARDLLGPVYIPSQPTRYLHKGRNKTGFTPECESETNTYPHTTTTEIPLLARRRISGTEINSISREPIPRCHPGTRKSLCSRIITWATNLNQHEPNLFWLVGPAGIGKSAVTQTVAEELKALRLLGAAFFFLKESNHYDDPTGIIASLAYQLALSHREYGRVVGEILSKDPTILGKGLALQFKQLLVEPFSTIMIQSACTTPKPVVVVLDGLDQYHDKQVQCEIVRLIGRYSQRDDFPLMWIISSRPEWHLVHLEPPVACIHENLCYLGRRDVEIYIKDGLRKIAQTYPELIEAWGTWPKGGDVYRLIKGAGDLFTVAKSILDFISSPKYSDPSLRLCLLLNFIANPSLTVPSITDNPFASIYAQYLSALSHFPRSLLPVVLQVFGLWCTQPSLTAFELANMLAIDRGTLHYILRHLHGIVRLSYDYDHNRQFLKHIHPSFLTFFSNPCLLHNNGLTPKISSTRISSAIARPLLDLLKPRLQIAQNRLSWKSQPPQGFTRQSLAIRDLAVSNEIVAWAMRLAWGFCAKIELSQSEYQNRFWYNYFVNFNFGQLGEDCGGCGRIPSTEFRAFLRWLYRLSIRCRPREHLIVRTSPSYPLDQEFIDKCEGIAEPLDCKSTVTPASVKYALLGVNSKSTLVLLTSDSVTVYSLNHLDDI